MPPKSADLIRYACDQMEATTATWCDMGKDPLKGYKASNFSVLRPYGVWVVISPFNFPCALTAGPAGAALVAGNTVVMKPATDTPWTVRLFAECLRDAGLPDGVFNYVTGPGSTLGQALIDNPEVDGITFTGSYDIGMRIFRDRSPTGATPARRSSSWAARTRPSSRARPTSNGRPSASCARPSACRGRSAPPARGSSSSGRCTTSW